MLTFGLSRFDTARKSPWGGGYLLVKDYWGCAAGWGGIFTTDYNGVTFLVELLECGRKFSGFLG